MSSQIRLCYIKGINRVDTPFFYSANEQRAYFQSVTIWTSSDSYYPPYYQNEIKVPSSEIQGKQINYAVLEGDSSGMSFYYFIDDIEYVNEDLVTLYLTMDTIQTYMFHSTFQKAFISRRSIWRWEGNNINRNFIRENLSTGNFRLKAQSGALTGDIHSGSSASSSRLAWILIKTSERLPVSNIIGGLTNMEELASIYSIGGNIKTRYDYVSDTNYKNVTNSTGGYLYLVPLFGIGVYFNGSGQSIPYSMNCDSKFLIELASDSRITNMHLLPFNPFEDITYVPNSTRINIRQNTVKYSTLSYSIWNFALCSLKYGDVTYTDSIIEIEVPVSFDGSSIITGIGSQLNLQAVSISLPSNIKTFSKNTSKKTIFDSSFVPALYDENYLHYVIACGGDESTINLQYATATGISCKWLASLDGTMAVSASVTTYPSALRYIYGTSEIDFNFGNVITIPMPQFDLFTDPWKNYNVEHWGTRVTDWIQIALGASANTAQSIGYMTSRAQSSENYQDRTQAIRGSTAVNARTAQGYITGFNTFLKSVQLKPERDDKGRYVSRRK